MNTRTTIPATANRLNVKGIQIEHSENALIHDNTAKNLGLSIKGAGSLLGTQFKCNTSDGSYNGFYFDASYGSTQTVISNQGISTLPNDNQWSNIPTNYFAIDAASSFSIIPQKTWYYRNATQFNPTLSNAALQGITKSNTGNPIQTSCTTCGGMLIAEFISPNSGSFITSTENEIESIIDESHFYNELDASFKYFEKQYAYHVLDANTASLNALSGQFYYDIKEGNIAKFDKICQLVQNNETDSAKLLNSYINPTNQIEINRKWVNDVYLDYIIPQVTIPQNMIDELETLANSSPFVLGDAVYSARAIVGYTETIVNNKSKESSEETISNNSITVNVYPNPANKNLSVEVVGLQAELCKFVIRNTLGIKLVEKIIKTNGEITSIDISKFSDGLYLYEVLNSGNIKINSGRLVISK